jgi:hypothetical protein
MRVVCVCCLYTYMHAYSIATSPQLTVTLGDNLGRGNVAERFASVRSKDMHARNVQGGHLGRGNVAKRYARERVCGPCIYMHTP